MKSASALFRRCVLRASAEIREEDIAGPVSHRCAPELSSDRNVL
jgi:hypothetical protein